MYRDKREIDTKNCLNIAFLGDISLNDDYVELYNRGANPFQEIETELEKADFVIGNLECMVKSDEGENLLKSPRLSTTLDTLNYLKQIQLSIVTLANNHVYDHLLDGYQKTCAKLDELGIENMGAGLSKEVAVAPKILKKNGITVGFLNYVTEDTHPNLPDNSSVHLNYFDKEAAQKDIIELKSKVDHVVILLHWGGTVENGYYPDKYQLEIARAMIRWGADLIIGHHSHTFQPFEALKDKMVFYSLGNFCFSDINFENKVIELQRDRHMKSAIVSISFMKRGYNFEIIPFLIKNNRLLLHYSLNKEFEKRNQRFQLLLNNSWFWPIYRFKLKKVNPVIFFFLVMVVIH